MTVDTEGVHLILRYVHIGPAFVGLVLFWVPVFATKGGRLHVRAGWAFAGCAGIVGGTGLISSVWALLDMGSFAGPKLAEIPERDLPRALEVGRLLFAVLAYLSLWVVSQLWFGIRVAQTRDRHEALRTPLLVGLHTATGLAALALLVFGVQNVLLSSPDELLPPGAASIYWIPVALGLNGPKELNETLGYILRRRSSPMAWWYVHMECMLTVGVAFHTAFAVFAVHGLFGLRLPGLWQFLPWLAPSMIGVAAIRLWVRVYRRRFADLPGKEPASPQGQYPAGLLVGGPAQETATR